MVFPEVCVFAGVNTLAGAYAATGRNRNLTVEETECAPWAPTPAWPP